MFYFCVIDEKAQIVMDICNIIKAHGEKVTNPRRTTQLVPGNETSVKLAHLSFCILYYIATYLHDSLILTCSSDLKIRRGNLREKSIKNEAEKEK